MISKRKFGNIGEELSKKYLQDLGYKILDTNFSCRQGEIDIIAKENEEYVFVEVKTRSNLNFGNPRDSVSKFKQKHIIKSTKYYLYTHNLENVFVRFDVIEVYLNENRYKIEHLKNVEMYDK